MTDWALEAQTGFEEVLGDCISKHQEINKNLRKELKTYAISLFRKMNVGFEPDPSYRENVRAMIIGLALVQMVKQRTINLFRHGKEDREYLASWAMSNLQNKLYEKKLPIGEWLLLIEDIYMHYKSQIKFDLLKDLVNAKIEVDKTLSAHQLKQAVESNEREYIKRRGVTPKSPVV